MVASYDESILDTSGIIQAVEKAGYGAIPKHLHRVVVNLLLRLENQKLVRRRKTINK